MKRLTKYEPSENSMLPYKLKDEELTTELDSIHKLGQLEDLMEEYNIKTLEQVECSFIGFITDFTEEGREHIGELLKLEDELGIDLITLFSALKNGVWYKDYKDSDNIKFTKDIEEHINWKELIVPAKYTHISLSFKDYGKTWALTKEALL